MAIMIPEEPRDFEPASGEGRLFEALKNLPDDYWVVHSFRLTSVEKNEMRDREIDFVIFHREKGLLCVEAKAGDVIYKNGKYHYSDMTPMKFDSPYKQADHAKHDLRANAEKRLGQLASRCKFLSAVWFHSVKKMELNNLKSPDSDRELTLTFEDLADTATLQNDLERIFKINSVNGWTLPDNRLSENDARLILDTIICPEFRLAAKTTSADLKVIRWNRLLEEQSKILDFIEGEHSVAIAGAAGTGKTFLALEFARRKANAGEKVLLLCFNTLLCSKLNEENKGDSSRIEIRTIDDYVSRITGIKFNSAAWEMRYEKAMEIVSDNFETEFPFTCLVIDECQDFGLSRKTTAGKTGEKTGNNAGGRDESKEKEKFIEEIKSWGEITHGDRFSFIVFYDKMQMVQARSIPGFIEKCDTRLTLHKNCRNTKSIGRTACSVLGADEPLFRTNVPEGNPVLLCYSESDSLSVKNVLDRILDGIGDRKHKDIVLLTFKKIEDSAIYRYCEEAQEDCYKHYRYQGIRFTTCRKFKGCEADTVILLDADRETFLRHHARLFYVGVSRARQDAYVVASLSDEDCDVICREILESKEFENPKREFQKRLHLG